MKLGEHIHLDIYNLTEALKARYENRYSTVWGHIDDKYYSDFLVEFATAYQDMMPNIAAEIIACKDDIYIPEFNQILDKHQDEIIYVEHKQRVKQHIEEIRNAGKKWRIK